MISLQYLFESRYKIASKEHRWNYVKIFFRGNTFNCIEVLRKH